MIITLLSALAGVVAGFFASEYFVGNYGRKFLYCHLHAIMIWIMVMIIVQSVTARILVALF